MTASHNVADISKVCDQRNMSGSRNYQNLMHEVCIEKGWCGGIISGKPTHVDDFIPKSGLVTSEQFVDWMFCAEGMDAVVRLEQWEKHKDSLVDAFIRHMGADVVDASMLREQPE